MTTSSGLQPIVSSTGIVAGDFAQWYAYLVAQYENIFGEDSYLGNDSQDGQFIGVLAQILSDVCGSAVAVYNSFSPATAVGAGQSSVVKINGLSRLTPTFSTVPLTIVGVAATVITNGQAIDLNQVVWNLPATVTIPSSGTINVTGTCSIPGAVFTGASTITGIQTPVYGWQSVTNGTVTLGLPVETDAALRVRQSGSVSLPSVTIFEGIVAALEQLTGVTRVKAYENNTGSTDANSTPAHTLYFLVEGGTTSQIQSTIAKKIAPGVGTRGSITTTVTDSNGSTRTINFDTPTDATITVAITLKALAGWQVATETAITAALVNYFNTLPGGSNISFLGLPAIALLPGTSMFGTFAITAMTIKKNSGSAVSADIQLAYNEMAVSNSGIYTYTVT